MSDSEALLATCAGAGATLVAIVGGLLVSRYLTLESEALGARKLAQSLEEKLNGARRRATESQGDHERYALREILTGDDFVRQFLGAVPRGGLPTEAVAASISVAGLSAETIAEVTKEFNAEAKRVRAFDWGMVPHANNHAYWDDFARENNIRPQIGEMWEYLYIEICKKRRPPEQPGRLGLPAMDMATMGIVSVPEQNRRRDIRNRLIDARDLDRAQVRRLEVELAAAVTARDSLEQPPGLVTGLAVLAFLTVTSVIVPVLLLAPTPATLTYRGALGVVGLFIAGIAVLLLYLGTHVHRLLRVRAAGSDHPNADRRGR
ncbi:hypothetical protein [Georgenia wangjunii]|uniref:hypothetical protein n=1 Tax=Georgenia wangjunii TaxID=3117730 RepID=UPI002F26AD9F